jgi:hypothetical protein
MQPSPEMQNFVNACELRHKTYLEDTGDKLKMRLGRRDLPLVLERTGLNTVRVAHELVNSDGQVVSDPEVIFFTGYEKWIALEINGASTLFTEIGKRGTHKVYATLNSTGTAIKDCKFGKQKELAQFIKYWVRLLRARGWHENSTNALFQQATLLPEDGLEDEDDGEDAASTERVKDLLQDELEDAGLMAEEPGSFASEMLGMVKQAAEDQPARIEKRLGNLRQLVNESNGIESVTLSSGNRSVTLTGKNHL